MVLWVFGYASLLWKAGFEYDTRVLGFIKGYRRAFHLACFEHRGTPELPARVATLESDDAAICWGYAFCVKEAEAAKRAMAYLEVRESEYDVKNVVEFFTEDSSSQPFISEVVVFMSTLENKYYLGAAPREQIAMQIARARGPSGPNCDYLFSLVEALRNIGHEDAEVIELAHLARKILSEKMYGGTNGLSGGSNGLLGIQNISSKPHNLIAGPAQSSSSHLPKLSTVVAISGLSHVPLSHMPCSPRLLKSQAL